MQCHGTPYVAHTLSRPAAALHTAGQYDSAAASPDVQGQQYEL
jgi:hypothetical protein